LAHVLCFIDLLFVWMQSLYPPSVLLSKNGSVLIFLLFLMDLESSKQQIPAGITRGDLQQERFASVLI
jgi:hypothetical protein